jgi:hypothetical protein
MLYQSTLESGIDHGRPEAEPGESPDGCSDKDKLA